MESDDENSVSTGYEDESSDVQDNDEEHTNERNEGGLRLNDDDVDSLYMACVRTVIVGGDLEQLKLVVACDRFFNADAVHFGRASQRPLHCAAYYNQLDIAKYLIEEKNATVDVLDRYNRTPLMEAAEEGHYEMMKLLILRGADVNAADGICGHTALHRSSGGTKLECVRLLCENGANVNAKDDEGVSPLHDTSDCAIFRLLLERGADLYHTDDDGYTVLHYACMLGYTEVTKLILEINESNMQNAVSEEGDTPLHRAGNILTAKMLVESGADIHARNLKGNTPLVEIRGEVVSESVLADRRARLPEIVEYLQSVEDFRAKKERYSLMSDGIRQGQTTSDLNETSQQQPRQAWQGNTRAIPVSAWPKMASDLLITDENGNVPSSRAEPSLGFYFLRHAVPLMDECSSARKRKRVDE